MTGREGRITSACGIIFVCNVKHSIGLSSLHLCCPSVCLCVECFLQCS